MMVFIASNFREECEKQHGCTVEFGPIQRLTHGISGRHTNGNPPREWREDILMISMILEGIFWGKSNHPCFCTCNILERL